MKVRLNPTSRLQGSVVAPPSKSYTHRYLACSLLAAGESIVEQPSLCEDVLATINACTIFGAEVRHGSNTLHIKSSGFPSKPKNVVDCKDSGTTLRFFTSIASLARGLSILTGSTSLRVRPMLPLLQALRKLGVKAYSVNSDGKAPIIVFGGNLAGGHTSIRGDISSQYISGLMIALTKAKKHSTIEVKGRLESKGYVDLTLKVLREFKAEVKISNDYRLIEVEPCQKLRPCKCRVPGDYSAASFIAVAAAITKESNVKIEGLTDGTLQPDSRVVSTLRDVGVDVQVGNFLEVRRVNTTLSSFEVDVRDCPDLVPPLVSLASFCKGKTVIKGVSRLKYKESNRLEALSHEFSKLGVDIKVRREELVINGKGRVKGGAMVNSWSDHRIAMALAVAGLGSEKAVIVEGFESVSKSYPKFIEDITKLGGNVQFVG